MSDEVVNTLAQWRSDAGLSQQDLADAIGVSRKTISTIERRKFTPSVQIALKLARHFGCGVDDLFMLGD
ncbi:helix-turn-helix transcriptional regulator [Aliidiomarina maris]|uniref:Transcriptional regulator n=1 Tax=Aliidiomarina maris TaxID=531312 RepID=A0A327WTZ1_9GAMM|nr:helix-turn-helix transcriptional regulator [Aliidiomarina maris]MBA3988887.1 transcriptional regulator [Idiomarina sp.]MCL5255088.1 helix-turn-helix transcriptional regulator [Gammaproteobacteria bacterium]RAJ94919.1 putative transcriptional regulator [Aliidiomarina maris]RUO22131.1 transcriptional regulator [Aliidiomarina maris]